VVVLFQPVIKVNLVKVRRRRLLRPTRECP
jgi:hypothetical protein